MSTLQVFSNPDFGAIRTVDMDGGPWFVGKDVARALGYRQPTKTAREKVDPEDRGVSKIDTPSGTQEMTIINESGLYALILSSKLPSAKKFKRWVTAEVLPTLRRQGSYRVKPMTQAQLIAAQAQALVEFERRLEAVEARLDGRPTPLVPAPVFTRSKTGDTWRDDMMDRVLAICKARGTTMPPMLGRMYQDLERATGCVLASRLTYLRKRERQAGMTYKRVHGLVKLDAVAADRTLRRVFEAIVASWE